MKASTIGFTGLAVFAGVLGGIQASRWIDSHGSPLLSTMKLAPASDNVRPASFGAVTSVPVDFRKAAEIVNPSVVSVDRYNARRGWDGARTGEARETGTGSGVILSANGIIVTNNHVVQDADRVTVRMSDNRTFDAKVLGTDQRSDLAVLKIEASNLPPIELGDSTKIEAGQWVLAVGNPLGFDNTVSVGVVSSVKRDLPIGEQGMVQAIQTDAAINPGNSGGALTDAEGRLIGINSAIASGTGMSVGIGFAIPVNHMRRIVDDIVKYGAAKYAGLGVRYEPGADRALAYPQVRAQIAEMVHADNVPETGLIVGDSEGSAAAAGIKANDIITSVANIPIKSQFDLNRALVMRKVGDVVPVEYWSHGQSKKVDVTLQEVSPK